MLPLPWYLIRKYKRISVTVHWNFGSLAPPKKQQHGALVLSIHL